MKIRFFVQSNYSWLWGCGNQITQSIDPDLRNMLWVRGLRMIENENDNSGSSKNVVG